MTKFLQARQIGVYRAVGAEGAKHIALLAQGDTGYVFLVVYSAPVTAPMSTPLVSRTFSIIITRPINMPGTTVARVQIPM